MSEIIKMELLIDEDLQERIKAIPEGKKNITKVFSVIREWEIEAVKKYRERENTAKSHLIDTITRWGYM